MLRKVLAAVFLLFLNFQLFAQDKDLVEIKATMMAQEKAWNSGDLNSFMAPYWKSDSLMFIGSRGITYGWEKTLQNYRKGYPDTAAMGKLNFDLLEIKRISDVHYFVVGKWALTRSVGNLNGHFTLLFKRISGKWLIVADHSS